MKTPACRPAARNVRVVRVGEFNPDGRKPLSGRVWSGLSGLSEYILERIEKRGSLTANSTTIARDSGRKFFIRRFSEKYPDNPANPDEPLRHSSFLDLPTRTEYPVRPGSTRTEQAYTPRSPGPDENNAAIIGWQSRPGNRSHDISAPPDLHRPRNGGSRPGACEARQPHQVHQHRLHVSPRRPWRSRRRKRTDVRG
jgi:hypothetical protein